VHAGRERHRRSHLLADDADALELARHQAEQRRPAGVERRHLVACDGAVQPADQQVGAAVAVEVAELGDVLAVGEDRRAVHVLQRVGDEHEAVGASPALVAVVLDVAERLLRQEIEVAIAVHVGEAIPLTHVDVSIPRRPQREPRQAVPLAVPVEQRDPSGDLLQEQIEVAVSIGIHELRPGRVEPGEERHVQRTPGGVRHRERGHDGMELEPAGLGAQRCRSRSAARHRGEEERGRSEGQEQGRSAAGRVPGGAGVMPRPAA
jgi:hypothetical protein